MDLTLTNSFDVVTSFLEPEISFFSDLVLGLRPFWLVLDTLFKTNYRNSGVFFYIELTFYVYTNKQNNMNWMSLMNLRITVSKSTDT